MESEVDLKPFASKDGLLYTGYIVIEDEDIFFGLFLFSLTFQQLSGFLYMQY